MQQVYGCCSEGLAYGEDEASRRQWLTTGSLIEGEADALQQVRSIEECVRMLIRQQPSLQAHGSDHKQSALPQQQHGQGAGHGESHADVSGSDTSSGTDDSSGNSSDSTSRDTDEEGSVARDHSSSGSMSDSRSQTNNDVDEDIHSASGEEEDMTSGLTSSQVQCTLQQWGVLQIISNEWDMELLRAAAMLDPHRYMLQAQNKDVYLVPAHVAAAVMVSMAGVSFDADGSSTHELQLNASYYRWAALVLAKSNNQQQQACALAHKLDELIKPLLEAHHGHLTQNTGEVCQAALQQVWSAVRRELSVVTPDTVGAATAEADEDEGVQDQSATFSGLAKPQAAGVGAERDDKESEQQLQQSDDAASSQVDQQLFQAIALLTGVGRKRVMICRCCHQQPLQSWKWLRSICKRGSTSAELAV